MRRLSLSSSCVWFAALALSCLVVVSRGGAQDVGPGKPDSPFNQGPFRIAAQARAPLHELWVVSRDVKQERVACLGGYVQGNVVYITHVEPLPPSHADSADVSAVASLRECSPPEWFGTVHTHIATFHGRPYTMFSAPDRFVMMLWTERWKQDGVFCILYTDMDATCEFGYTLSSHAPYAYARGNNILF